ncbi:hypothetical protein AMTRI_Chr01g103230 [Amborella trichopoda]
MAFYSVFLEAIPAYTGLSPVAFFTTLALMVGVYHLVCALFVSDPPPPNATSRSAMEMMSMPVNLEPVQLGDVTEEELRAYDGSDPTKPLLMAIKGQIYDVTRSRVSLAKASLLEQGFWVISCKFVKKVVLLGSRTLQCFFFLN